MSDRERLFEKFDELPKLSNDVLASSPFRFPKRVDPNADLSRGSSPLNVTGGLQPLASRAEGSVSRLRDTIGDAANKTKFGETSIAQWEAIMQFAGSKTRRKTKEERFEIVSSEHTHWEENEPINLSAESAKDWFKRCLLERLKEGNSHRHSHAVLGDQGCGKSTLIKYLVSTNAPEIREQEIVFCRFEFLKFWDNWRQHGQDVMDCLSSYMSFIHLRDLLLDHFFNFQDGNSFVYTFPYELEVKRQEEIERLTRAVIRDKPTFEGLDEAVVRMNIEDCVAAAAISNADLMEKIRKISHDRRLALISALWDEKCLVTVFDGLDSLKIEDAFQQTEQWQAIQKIIRRRAWLSMPTNLADQGVSKQNDSIIVIRKSTAAFLELQSGGFEDMGLRHYYHVAPIDSRAAMVSVIRRAIEDLSDYSGVSAADCERDTFRLMKVVQRSMVAFGRLGGGSTAIDAIYNLFDGNLRDLFEFIANTIDWSCSEMIKHDYLDYRHYFSDVPTLIQALSSNIGYEFLMWKSYRVVEQLLLGKGKSFENAARVLRADGSLLQTSGVTNQVRANPDHYGQIDNIFNYLSLNKEAEIDRHPLLEKVRIAQMMWDEPVNQTDVGQKMRTMFGTEPWDEKLVLMLMLKTGFLSAEISRGAEAYAPYFRTTPKAKLCVTSLIGNLAYLENVFHQTLFPQVLVEHVSDRVRDENDPLEWAIASVRNAFIFLTYFKHIEQNPADGVVVPEHLQLFSGVHKRVRESLERMTKALVRTTYDSSDRKDAIRQERSRAEAKLICKGALAQIDETMRLWTEAGAISGAR